MSDDEDDGATAMPPAPSPSPSPPSSISGDVECPACQLAAMCGSAKCSKHSKIQPPKVVQAPDCPACQLAAMCGGAKCMQHRGGPGAPTLMKEPSFSEEEEAPSSISSDEDENSSDDEAAVKKEEEQRTSHIVMANACCEVEIDLAKGILGSFESIVWVKTNLAARTVLVRHRGPVAPYLLELNKANLGARLADIVQEATESGQERRFELSRDAVIAAFAMFVTFIGAMLQFLTPGIPTSKKWVLTQTSWLFLSTVYFSGMAVVGRRIITRVWRQCLMSGISGLVHLVKPDLNLLAALAASCGYWTGNATEGAFVVAIFAVAEQIEGAVIGRVGKALDVTDLDDDEEITGHKFTNGDVVEVRAGERVPCDGKIFDGKVWIDEAKLNGESIPKLKKRGDHVLKGTIAVDGWARIECTTLPMSSKKNDSSPAGGHLREALAEAQTTTSPTVEFGNKVAGVFGPLALVASFLVFAIPVLFLDGRIDVWLRNALVVAVTACPCALALAAPAPTAAAIAAAAKRKVIIKSAAALDACRSISVVAFDKTGTLTAGHCHVVGETWVGPEKTTDTPEAVLRLAAAVETKSTHPIAAAVVKRAVGHAGDTTVFLDVANVKDFRLLDAGVTATVDGRTVTVRQAGEVAGEDDVVIAIDETPLLALRLEDEIRPTAAPALHRLFKDKKRRLAVLTGDREKPARIVVDHLIDDMALPDNDDDSTKDSLLFKAAKQQRRRLPKLPKKLPLHISRPKKTKQKYARLDVADVDSPTVFASLTPDAKAKWIRGTEESVLFVGDGVNDALSLKAATVGVAVCATAAAVDAADVVVLHDDLNAVPDLVDLAFLVRRLALQNVALAIGIKLLAVVVLLTKPHLGLGLAVLADLVSLLVVIANGCRPLRKGRWCVPCFASSANRASSSSSSSSSANSFSRRPDHDDDDDDHLDDTTPSGIELC